MRGWLCVLVLAACSSPAAGGWRGTADIGPIAAYEMSLRFSDNGGKGQVMIREPTNPSSGQWFTLCSLQIDRRVWVATYDPGSVECQGPAGDRRELRGVVGEGVAWGEVWQAGNKTGFFRAFRVPPPAPGEAAAAPSGGAPTP